MRKRHLMYHEFATAIWPIEVTWRARSGNVCCVHGYVLDVKKWVIHVEQPRYNAAPIFHAIRKQDIINIHEISPEDIDYGHTPTPQEFAEIAEGVCNEETIIDADLYCAHCGTSGHSPGECPE